MPELPEVETVRQGLSPFVEGATIEKVVLNRENLRFAFPEHFVQALSGQTITQTSRRAKYLLFHLSNGLTWLSHLGMTGSYRFDNRLIAEPSRYYEAAATKKHDHLEVFLSHPEHGKLVLLYTDARRFGFMDIFEKQEDCPYLKDLGPEPLGNAFSGQSLAERFKNKKSPVKSALLDQRVVAGLGNIYVSEALHRAHIRPDTPAGSLVAPQGGSSERLENLAQGVRTVLAEAIDAGGSTLRDFRQADGNTGYFQHRFSVYDREGKPCPTPRCPGVVERIVQAGRSSFFCPMCQKP
jgi:formamidopyrimidine-DNA glycosylase